MMKLQYKSYDPAEIVCRVSQPCGVNDWLETPFVVVVNEVSDRVKICVQLSLAFSHHADTSPLNTQLSHSHALTKFLKEHYTHLAIRFTL